LVGRLEALGVKSVDARAHGLGIEVSALVQSPKDVENFFVAVQRALGQPVSATEPSLTRARREVAAVGALRFAGPGESAVAQCSGELGVSGESSALDLTKPEGVAHLEAVRSATYRVEAAAFAALGPSDLVAEAADALSETQAWPTGAADADAWPEADAVFVDRAEGKRQLSLALWLPDADVAVGAGLLLGRDDSELLTRLSNLAPPWRLTRTAAIARRRGACLRLDVAPPEGDPGPTAGDVGRVVSLLELTAISAVQQTEPGALDESVLRPTDPRRAAALAAWRALPTASLDPSAVRRSLAFIAGPNDALNSADLARAITESRARLARPTLELNERLESGQGEVWMLLASPCGTAVESLADAGAFALLLRALARGAGATGVRFEPWVTPDGVGVLAHGPRRSPAEPASEHAARVAGALGRVMTQELSGRELGAARTELLTELGGRSFAGFALALEGLSPEHPSWLEPRGLWGSVSDLPTEALERARRLLLSSPLRLSVLASAPGQAQVAAAELESWLMAFRTEARACPSARVEAPRRGQVRVEARDETFLEGAYVGVGFGMTGARAARLTELSALVLNRPGGLLEQALAASAPAASARAHALGGTRRPALLIDVRALPDRLPDAVGRVRGVLDQLARGAVATPELAFALSELARRDASARFDPRRRIVDLWRGELPAAVDVAMLRSAHASLGSGAHWVVTVSPPP